MVFAFIFILLFIKKNLSRMATPSPAQPSPAPFTQLSPSRAVYSTPPRRRRRRRSGNRWGRRCSAGDAAERREGEELLCYLFAVDGFRFLLDCVRSDHYCDHSSSPSPGTHAPPPAYLLVGFHQPFRRPRADLNHIPSPASGILSVNE
jgi:hypothetical protein